MAFTYTSFRPVLHGAVPGLRQPSPGREAARLSALVLPPTPAASHLALGYQTMKVL
jgi:hypothetical protein